MVHATIRMLIPPKRREEGLDILSSVAERSRLEEDFINNQGLESMARDQDRKDFRRGGLAEIHRFSIRKGCSFPNVNQIAAKQQ